MLLRKSLFLFSLISLIILLPSCWGERVEKKKGLVVVNVLDKHVYDDCHITDSISIPFDKIDEVIKKIDKNAEIVLYCSNYMCASSSAARKELLKMGYKKVFVYEGGTAEWYQKGFPVKGPCKGEYLKITLEVPKKKRKSFELTAEALKVKMDAFKDKKR